MTGLAGTVEFGELRLHRNRRQFVSLLAKVRAQFGEMLAVLEQLRFGSGIVPPLSLFGPRRKQRAEPEVGNRRDSVGGLDDIVLVVLTFYRCNGCLGILQRDIGRQALVRVCLLSLASSRCPARLPPGRHLSPVQWPTRKA